MAGAPGNLARTLRDGAGPWLFLFDIDGTLVDVGGKGMAALQRAAVEVFGGDGPPLDLAGSTDLGVLESLYGHFNLTATDERTHRFFEEYHRQIETGLEAKPVEGKVLDGALDLLERLSRADEIQLGLLTGNTALGAEIKLRQFGLSHFFTFGAYGSDRADRNLLGRIALERAFAMTGHAFQPDNTLVIGDTPKDIACAHTMGARCVAVATGRFSAGQLEDAGADWVLDSLRDFPD